jgi:hypothetical protein
MDRKSTWKKMIQEEMRSHKESLEDIVSNTMTEEEMNAEFNSGYGGEEGIPFTVWTKKRVYFPICYDGAEWVGSASRKPDGIAMHHQGGG